MPQGRRSHDAAKSRVFRKNPAVSRRTYLSDPMHQTHRAIRTWCERSGCDVRIDAAGNLRAIYTSSDNSKRLVIASHLDTVPNAGAFDGVLGVMIGLALIESFEHGAAPLTIELIGFSEEEGVRFSLPFIGSRAVTGDLTEPEVTLIAPAIRAFGLDPADLPKAILASELRRVSGVPHRAGSRARLEEPAIGIVSAIAGQSRFMLHFQGAANHAGNYAHGHEERRASRRIRIDMLSSGTRATPPV